MTAEIQKCHHFNSGFCKFTTNCKLFHPTEVCEKNCKDKACKKRHPKPCKKGEKCSFHEKEACAYKHSNVNTKVNKELKDMVDSLSTKVDSLIETINAKDKELSALNLKVDNLENKTSKLEKPDLNETLEDIDWEQNKKKVQELEEHVNNLQETSQKTEQTVKYNAIGIKDTDECLQSLIKVVTEHNEVILNIEKQVKKQDKEHTDSIEKIETITEIIKMAIVDERSSTYRAVELFNIQLRQVFDKLKGEGP